MWPILKVRLYGRHISVLCRQYELPLIYYVCMSSGLCVFNWGKIVVNESFVVNSSLGFYREIAKANYGSMILLPIVLGFLDSLDFMLDRNGDEPLGTSA